MGGKIPYYLDFAENDYVNIITGYDAGARGGLMCFMCQKTCERYLKFAIQLFPYEEAPIDVMQSQDLCVLREHIKSVERSGWELGADWDKIMKLNKYNSNVIYPGPDSFIATAEDAEECVDALKHTREIVLKFIGKHLGGPVYVIGFDEPILPELGQLADLADGI